MSEKAVGYHLTEIPQGKYGEVSKIQEELAELQDAIKQGNKILALVELSDLYGAIEGFLAVSYPGFNMEDLKEMSGATKRAFLSGVRPSKD